MKNLKKIVALTLLTSLSANAIGLVNPSNSSISYAATKIDLGMSTKCATDLSITLNLKQDQATRDQALAAIKKIRSEMWDKNVPFTDEEVNTRNEGIRDFYLRRYGSSKDEYVNHPYMSSDLELLAIQRLFDISITGFFFNRPDGTYFEDLRTPKGSSSWSEGLASDAEKMSLDEAFNIWSYRKLDGYGGKSAYDKLVESNGVITKENYVLHCILDPMNTNIGLAFTDTPEKNYAVIEFAHDSYDGKAENFVGKYTMDYGPEVAKSKPSKNKALSKEQREKLEQSISENKTQISAVKLLFEAAPNKVEKVKDRLLALMDKSEKLIQKAEKILQQ